MQRLLRISNSASETLSVNSEVPQGSVLWPLLFFIYINDIFGVINSFVGTRLLADDCVLFKEICSFEGQEVLLDSLLAISHWCNVWIMELNTNKTVLLGITNKKKRFTCTYFIENNTISEVNKCKYLGITLTNNLSLSAHKNNISSSAFRKFGLIRTKHPRPLQSNFRYTAPCFARSWNTLALLGPIYYEGCKQTRISTETCHSFYLWKLQEDRFPVLAHENLLFFYYS